MVFRNNLSWQGTGKSRAGKRRGKSMWRAGSAGKGESLAPVRWCHPGISRSSWLPLSQDILLLLQPWNPQNPELSTGNIQAATKNLVRAPCCPWTHPGPPLFLQIPLPMTFFPVGWHSQRLPLEFGRKNSRCATSLISPTCKRGRASPCVFLDKSLNKTLWSQDKGSAWNR